MKLALAIAVCVYLCAVSVVRPVATVYVLNLEFQRFLEFASGDPKYKDFPQTFNRHVYFKNILKEVNRHDKLLEFSDYDHSMSYTLLKQAYEDFCTDITAYKAMYDNYETIGQDLAKANHDQYKMFLDDVDDKFKDFLKSAKVPAFEADLNFKLKCILAFRNAGDSSSSTSKTSGGTTNIAYDILQEQLGTLTQDEKKAMTSKASGKSNGAKVMKKIWQKLSSHF